MFRPDIAEPKTPETVGASGPSCKSLEQRRPQASWPSPQRPKISAEELAIALLPHVLTAQRMWTMGYPLEIEPNSCKAIIYVNPPPRSKLFTTLNVNAPEFVPSSEQTDSGRGSWGSSPRSDSDEEVDSVARECVRCGSRFHMTRDGDYITSDECYYHWGRFAAEQRYSCCKELAGSVGCAYARLHVWSGKQPGMNGPLDGYVRARSPRGGVYAIDAEMCYTTSGLELASIAVIGADGRLVYRALVRPSSEIVDLNTRFSGIRPRDMMRATKTLKDVQNDILGFVGTDTILIGHALENDLRALKLLHSAVVDTCALYPHARGWPLRRSLRELALEYLGRTVQGGMHSPLEDARAAMDLVLLRVHEDRARYRPALLSSALLPPALPLLSLPPPALSSPSPLSSPPLSPPPLASLPLTFTRAVPAAALAVPFAYNAPAVVSARAGVAFAVWPFLHPYEPLICN